MILATGDAIRFIAEIGMTFVAYGIYTFFLTGYRMQLRRAVKRVEAQGDAGSSTAFRTIKPSSVRIRCSTETRRLLSVLDQ
ncbi:hypothetical protein [Caballeronia humi]|uniref:Uncharacterized protein n=1 Tax=Caballeronia humi TaxID=326474 RepID=A0A158IVE6_9BURK|nr:hypothetical protein [Caballeronia humi]SAL60567.1 hypothetical protein AWB65_05465 [Caballeronia humi]